MPAMPGGFIGDDQVRKVKEAVDLVQLMGEYTSVRKAGRQYACCCPFHQEKSPSCYLYDDGHYYCFGCGANGDAISLVIAKENLPFTDAVELLARRAGIQLVFENTGRGGMSRGERDDLLAAFAFATAFYERILWDSPDAAEARTYLERRKLSRAVCTRFRVGWAPGRGELVSAARAKGFDPRLLLKLDLAVDRDGRATDRFFERVTFPICDRFGNPIAFSARLLPAAEKAAKEAGRSVGKYVNNTDTPLYHKGTSVFNLHHARIAAKDAGRLIVMEGPTDVMAADQAGYHECIAVLGTALTPEHAKQLGALVGGGQLIILLDGDRAGQANAIKAIRTCLGVGVQVRVATLPDELDPAELLAESETGASPEAKSVFEKVLASARHDVDHLLRAVAPRPYDLDNRAQVEAVDEILAVLRPMPDAELRSLHLRDVAEYFGIERDRLQRRLAEGAMPATRSAAAEPPSDQPTAPPLPQLDPHQDTLLHLLVAIPVLRADAADQLGLEPAHLPTPWSDLLGAVLLHPDSGIADLAVLDGIAWHPGLVTALRRYAATPLDARYHTMATGSGEAQIATELAEELRRRVAAVKGGAIRTSILRLGQAINDAERERKFDLVKELFSERSRLQQELRVLGG